jgi:hypothetical protein
VKWYVRYYGIQPRLKKENRIDNEQPDDSAWLMLCYYSSCITSQS